MRGASQSHAGGAGTRVVVGLAGRGPGGPASTQSPTRALSIASDDLLAGEPASRQRKEQRREPDRAGDARRMMLGGRSVRGLLLACLLLVAAPEAPQPAFAW